MPVRDVAGRWIPAALPAAASPCGLDSAWLDQIIARSPIATAVIDFDGRYRAVNPAYCALYGHPPEVLLAGTFLRVFEPALHASLLARHQRFLAEGGELKGEWEVQRHDGERLKVVSESVRVPDADGRLCRLVYVLDITQRQHMERSLQAAHQFLQSVIDALAAHVCVIDETGTIVAVNQAWSAFATANGGDPASSSVGSNYLAVWAGATPGDAPRPDFASRLRALLAGQGVAFELEYACHSPTEQRWFVARASRIHRSVPAHFVIAHDNVTALKLAQQAAHQREALLRELAAKVPGVLYRIEVEADGGSRFTYVSPGIEPLCGLSPAQMLADRGSMLARIEPEDLPGHLASIRAATRALQHWSNEYRIRALDGRLRWVQSIATPTPLPDGRVAWSGMLTDISDRKAAEARLTASEETYRTLFETVPQGVVYHDTAGRITSANPAALRILGLSLDQLQVRQSIDPAWQAVREDGSPFPGELHPAMQALSTGRPVNDVVMGVQAPGRGLVWIRVSATPLFKNGRIDAVYASFEDITQHVALSRQLQRQASTDDLTGVANRRSFMARLGIEFQRLARHAEVQCSLVALDIDLFKLVNDGFGHAAGDAVLRHVTQLMQQVTRQGDLVGRTGGEEFMLLLPDTGLDDALALARRLCDQVAQSPAPWQGQNIRVTLSAGVSLLLASDAGIDDALARADQALYEAKHAGRNTVRPALQTAP